MKSSSKQKSDFIVRHLGLEAYETTWSAMQAFTRDRDENTADELWAVQHPPVFTLGQAGKMEHILDPHDVPVIKTDRGGQVTYHGPGQLVLYILCDVKRSKLGVRQLVDAIEQSIISLLADYGIEANTKARAPGVYVNDRKIAALGLRIRKGCSYHGLSFNIDMDMSPFSWINPCGYEGLESTQLRDLIVEPGPDLFELSEKNLIRVLLQNLL